jgi:UDP:flavonoid glycosyltransferase YjiC (YdhE family)
LHTLRGSQGRRVLVVTWGSGGNLPPLLAAGDLLAARGFRVEVLTSAATGAEARRRGFETQPYRRAPEPDMTVSFEAQERKLRAHAAGVELARDVHELALECSFDLLVVDCMLPAALAAGEAARIPTTSLVHFPYALARSVMVRRGGAWTTDRAALDATRRELGLPATTGDVDAWESPELLLVALPRWFDAPGDLPDHVVHAGPLGVRAEPEAGRRRAGRRALLAFSTTVMEGQPRLVSNVCAALERAGIEGVLTLGPALARSVAADAAGVEVLEWADHDALMSNCDLVITHGGLGTVLRALAHGQPLLVLPLGRDQHFNAARVEALGAGLELPANSPPPEIADAVVRLLGQPAFRDGARKAARAIASEHPDQTAGEALARLSAAG